LLETLFPDPEGNEAWSRSVEDLGDRALASRASLTRASELAVKHMAQLEQTPSIVPARGSYSSGFGWRLHPILGEYMMHEGQDISGPIGLPVVATAAGKVVEEEFSSSFGNYVVLAHGGGIRTLYAHLSAFRCEVGKSVRRGEVIGLLGTTGRSTGPHVHYEVHVDGKPVDPLPWILPTTLVP
jgi:murein DD-endopeptidase MepM/ murein hydrolase activator NlpD